MTVHGCALYQVCGGLTGVSEGCLEARRWRVEAGGVGGRWVRGPACSVERDLCAEGGTVRGLQGHCCAGTVHLCEGL